MKIFLLLFLKMGFSPTREETAVRAARRPFASGVMSFLAT